MKKFLILIFSISSIIVAQEKYLIYFNDKNIDEDKGLNKSSGIYKKIENSFSKQTIERRKKVMGKNFVTYEDFPVSQKYISELEKLNITIIHKLKWFNAVSAYLTKSNLKDLDRFSFIKKIEQVKNLKKRKDIVYNSNKSLKKKKQLYSALKYNYGLSEEQYLLSEIPQVHKFDITGKGVIIGLMDTGFKKSIVSLFTRNVLDEYDFVFNDKITTDEFNDKVGQASHGTAVFSLIGGFDEGNIVGPAFNSSYLLAKTEDIRGEKNIEEDNFVAGLEWLENKGAMIISISLGYTKFDEGENSYGYQDMDGKTTLVTKAVAKAFDKGVLVIAAAGNDGDNSWKYISAPADGINVVAVGAVSTSNSRANFSSVGPTADNRIKPEITAMGVKNYVATAASKGSKYRYGSGTSYATPIASGCAAQLLETYPFLTNVQMRHIILEAAQNSDKPNNLIGYGLISSLKIIDYPNIEKKADKYFLNKTFLSDSIFSENAIEIYFGRNISNLQKELMQFEKPFKYKFDFSSFAEGDTINFYFLAKGKNGQQQKRYPTKGFYKFLYGVNKAFYNIPINKKTNIEENSYPNKYLLKQNYPNPFNNGTIIEYEVNESGYVNLTVYNILGEKVSTLVSGFQTIGKKQIRFTGKNLSSGIYIYKLRVNNYTNVRKMIYLK